MITHKVFNDTNELPSDWDEVANNDVFLKHSFLSALEASSPKNISSYYLAVYRDSRPVAVAVIQRVEIYYNDIFRKSNERMMVSFGKDLVSKIIRGNALVVGNLMHTGHHGFAFNQEMIRLDVFLETINRALNEIQLTIKQNFNKKIRIIAFKDFFENDPIHQQSAYFAKNKFYKVRVQPNMVFDIPLDWSRVNDYVCAFNKKYRRRYRTALKKKKPIEVKELGKDDVNRYTDRLYELYENVSDNAKVNSFKLHSNHFCELKQHLGDRFKVFGYFFKERLIGFFTLVLNDSSIETYFLGYDLEYQGKHQMYLNMLFDMASFGIEHHFDKVVFARTAMEIKSSVGAKPHEMSIYLKHTNSLLANSILKFIVRYMNPILKWEERHPFSK